MILVDGLTKVYGRLKAVDDLSFSVAGGEVRRPHRPERRRQDLHASKCIVGIQAPSAGTVRIAGHDIVAEAIEAKRRLAFMPDEPQLFDYLTVREHLALVARLYGVRTRCRRGRSRSCRSWSCPGKRRRCPASCRAG